MFISHSQNYFRGQTETTHTNKKENKLQIFIIEAILHENLWLMLC